MEEVWKDIPGYGGKYQASNLGRIRSTRFYGSPRIKILKPSLRTDGYEKVTLVADGNVHKGHLVHRLVASAFIPNPDGLEMVNHKDEVRTNNCVKNLEWCTRSYNQIYSMNLHKDRRMVFARNLKDENNKSYSSWTRKGVAHARTEPVRQSTYDGEFIKIHDNACVAAKEVGCRSGNILGACKRNARTDRVRKRKRKAGTAGYVWEYADK